MEALLPVKILFGCQSVLRLISNGWGSATHHVHSMPYSFSPARPNYSGGVSRTRRQHRVICIPGLLMLLGADVMSAHAPRTPTT